MRTGTRCPSTTRSSCWRHRSRIATPRGSECIARPKFGTFRVDTRVFSELMRSAESQRQGWWPPQLKCRRDTIVGVQPEWLACSIYERCGGAAVKGGIHGRKLEVADRATVESLWPAVSTPQTRTTTPTRSRFTTRL